MTSEPLDELGRQYSDYGKPMTSPDERKVIAEVPLRNLTAEHERAVKAEQRATAAEAEVERLKRDNEAHFSMVKDYGRKIDELFKQRDAERRLREAAVAALRAKWISERDYERRFLGKGQALADLDEETLHTFLYDCGNLSREFFDRHIASGGTGT